MIRTGEVRKENYVLAVFIAVKKKKREVITNQTRR